MTAGRATVRTGQGSAADDLIAVVPARSRRSVETDRRGPRRSGRLRYQRVRMSSLDREIFDGVYDEMGVVMTRATMASSGGVLWAPDDWNRRREWIRRNAVVYLSRDRGRLVGFLAYRVVELEGRACVHMLAAYVLPDYQSCGVAYSMNARASLRVLARRPWAPYYLAADVLSPIALDGWRKRVADPTQVFPRLGVPSIDEGLRRAATHFAHEHYHGLDFDESTGLLRAKTLPRGQTEAWSGNPLADELFRCIVDAERGDTILLLADFDRRSLLKSIRSVVRAIPHAVSHGIRPRSKRGERSG